MLTLLLSIGDCLLITDNEPMRKFYKCMSKNTIEISSSDKAIQIKIVVTSEQTAIKVLNLIEKMVCYALKVDLENECKDNE